MPSSYLLFIAFKKQMFLGKLDECKEIKEKKFFPTVKIYEKVKLKK